MEEKGFGRGGFWKVMCNPPLFFLFFFAIRPYHRRDTGRDRLCPFCCWLHHRRDICCDLLCLFCCRFRHKRDTGCDLLCLFWLQNFFSRTSPHSSYTT